MNPLLKYYMDRWNRQDNVVVTSEHYIPQLICLIMLERDEAILEEFEAFMRGRTISVKVCRNVKYFAANEPGEFFSGLIPITVKLIDGQYLVFDYSKFPGVLGVKPSDLRDITKGEMNLICKKVRERASLLESGYNVLQPEDCDKFLHLRRMFKFIAHSDISRMEGIYSSISCPDSGCWKIDIKEEGDCTYENHYKVDKKDMPIVIDPLCHMPF